MLGSPGVSLLRILPFALTLVAALAACAPPEVSGALRCRSSLDCVSGYECSSARGECVARVEHDAGADVLDAGRDAADGAVRVDAALPDAGSKDAGPHDAGDGGTRACVPEACDGLDNDCDGIADNGADVCPCDVRWRSDLEPYLFCSYRRRWPDARQLCSSLEAYRMVVLEDAAEEAWLLNELGTAPPLYGPQWLGLSDLALEGTFVWDDGSPLVNGAHASWTPGDPSLTGNENCVWRIEAGWQDITCNTVRNFVCEAHPSLLDPAAACVDNDGDGYGPGCARGPDCDDGDAAAWRWLAGALNEDGDGLAAGPDEWVCSGDELPPRYLSPPTALEDCDDTVVSTETTCDCHVLRRAGQRYSFCEVPATFEGAREACVSLGQDLFIAADLAEEEWAQRVAIHLDSSANPEPWWIGAMDGSGQVLWVNDAGVADPNYGGVPPGPGNGEDCMTLGLFGWGDALCETPHRYICK